MTVSEQDRACAQAHAHIRRAYRAGKRDTAYHCARHRSLPDLEHLALRLRQAGWDVALDLWQGRRSLYVALPARETPARRRR